jgi:hypothetical protein
MVDRATFPRATTPPGPRVTGCGPDPVYIEWHAPGLTGQDPSTISTGSDDMAKTGNKRRARRKKKANHGKRPNS